MSAIDGPLRCRAVPVDTPPDRSPVGAERARLRRFRRTEPEAGDAPDYGRPHFPPIVVSKTQVATGGAIRRGRGIHRRVRSAGVVLQWHAVRRHGARRALDGCARHRSGRQLLPSTTTATGDDAAAGPRRHALTEAVLASPAATIRLVGTLHDLSLWGLRHGDPTPTPRLRPHETRSRRRLGRSWRLGRPHAVGDHTGPLRPDRIVRCFGRRPRTATVTRSYRARRPLNARAPTGPPQRRRGGVVRVGPPQPRLGPRDCPHVIPRRTQSRLPAWGKPHENLV
jgi:hypothetical protein